MKRRTGLMIGGGAILLIAAGGLIFTISQREPAPVSGVATVRLISNAQYEHALRDIFGADLRIEARFASPPRSQGLLSLGMASVTMTQGTLDLFYRSARDVAVQVVDEQHRDTFVNCAPADVQMPDDACAEKFFVQIGRLLYRRPMSDTERATYIKAAHEGTETFGDFYAGLAQSLAGLLVSPQFLHLTEKIEPDPDHPDRVRLDGWSKATRLALFLWDSFPDAALLEAAQTGEIHKRSGLKRQIERMLSQPDRVERGVRAFFTDWLLFEKFDALSKDPELYPTFIGDTLSSAREQMLKLITDHLLTRQADYRELFVTTRSVVDRDLGVLLQLPVTETGWVPVTLSAHRQAGLLATPGFLAMHSHPGRSSPTLRGKAIREELLCQRVPDPPPNVDFDNFEASHASVKTARERLTLHSTDPVCAGCHKITDPIGLALENFDTIGQFRTDEMGAQIDVSGDLDGTAFSDVASFGKALGNHPALTPCLVSRLFAHATGREIKPADRTYLAWLVKGFAKDGYRYPDLLRHIALSRAFFVVKN